MALEDIDELNEMLLTVAYDDEGYLQFMVKCGFHNALVRRILTEHGIPSDAYGLGVLTSGAAYSPPEYNSPDRDLRYRCIPPEVVDPATGISSPGFGGLYRGDDGVYVYLLEPSQELAHRLVRDELNKRIWYVRAIQGQYTWDQLREWYYLLKDADWREDANIRSVALRPEDNRLTLMGSGDENGDLDFQKISDELTKLGIPCNAVLLDENDTNTSSSTEVEKSTDPLSKTTLCDSVALLEESE